MVIRSYSSQMCRTPFTEYLHKSLLIGSQSLLPCFVENFCILLSHLSIYLRAFMTWCGYICKQNLNQRFFTKYFSNTYSLNILEGTQMWLVGMRQNFYIQWKSKTNNWTRFPSKRHMQWNTLAHSNKWIEQKISPHPIHSWFEIEILQLPTGIRSKIIHL